MSKENKRKNLNYFLDYLRKYPLKSIILISLAYICGVIIGVAIYLNFHVTIFSSVTITSLIGDIFRYYLGEEFLKEGNLMGMISTTYIFLIALFILFILHGFFKFKKTIFQFNWWIIWTIWFVFYVFFIGIFLIGSFYDTNIGLSLNEKLNTSVKTEYSFKCDNPYDYLYAEQEYHCKLIPEFENFTISNSFVKYSFENRTTKIQNLSNDFTISPPKGTKGIYVEINIYDILNNESHNMSSYHIFEMTTLKEHEDNKKNFLKNITFLLTLVFFSIPTFFVNLKNLKNKK